MNMRKLLSDFEQDGFLVIEDFFDPDLMDDLDHRIRDHFGDNPEFLHDDLFIGKSKAEVVPWFPQNEGVIAFDEINEKARFRGLTTTILGAGWSSQNCMVMFSAKGTNGQAWHQDCSPDDADDATVFNLNRLVYTSDISDKIGGQTVVVPGSFRQGILPAGDPLGEFKNQVVLRPKKGTLILLHGHTWHRVLPITGARRYSTNYRAAPAGTPDDVTDVCVYRNMRYRFSTCEVVEERVEA
jgi:hypothetical protein